MRPRWDRGMTLVELLAVMAIIGLLAGLSVSALRQAGEGPALDGAERIVRTALARARAIARERLVPSEVHLWQNQVVELKLLTLGDAATIGFEGDFGQSVLAGGNNFAALQGARIVPAGSIREGADLTSGSVVMEPLATTDPTLGFRFEADLWPKDADAAGEIASYGDVWSLRLVAGGRLEAVVAVEDQGQAIAVTTAPGLFEPGRWTRVGLVVDGIVLRILVRGAIEVERPLRKEPEAGAPARGDVSPFVQLSRSLEPARFQLGRRGVGAIIDEVIYRTVEDGESARLPGGIELDPARPIVVRFGPDGRLDPRIHDDAVVVTLRSEDDRRVVEVDRAGVLR